jgi:tetratricopeptide (TPR) repeat protein
VQLAEHRVEDLDYGRALYQFFQDNRLSAITHLMIAKERPRTRSQINQSNLLLADLYYGYGLYEESRELFARLLTAEVSDSIQNRIWFNLARLRYEQGYYEAALDLLSRINNQLPGGIESERKYLLTNLYLGSRQYDEAADLSDTINSKSIWKIYARYNLGVSMIEDDRYEPGRYLLDKIGQMKTVDSPELRALRDRSNLSLGLKQLRMELPEPALESLSRIRLEGPLSNQALLASGWAWYRLEQFDKAMIPWRVLLQRNAVDAATQEAILAIPTNYAESGQDKLAVRHYQIAAEQFDLQLQVLDNSIKSIENDGLIAALRENAILYDRSSLQRLPPSSDVTPQLHILLASTEFQREIKRYQELLDIRNSLRYWGTNFPALELMLEERRRGFEQNLPRLQQSSSFDQLELLRERRNQFATRVSAIESNQDYAALATPEEQEHLSRLQRVASTIDKLAPERNTAYQQDMFRLLSGLLNYELATDFPVRFWKSKKQLILLDRALSESEQRAKDLRGISERTDMEFGFFSDRISGQTQRIRDLRNKVTTLLTAQENLINQMAINEIRRQQQHIVQLRLNARFELAKLYDRMAAEQ